MECIFLFVGMLMVLGVLLGFSVAVAPGSGRRATAFVELARRYNGQLHRPGWFGYPRVSLLYGPHRVLVREIPYGTLKGHRGPSTQVLIDWPDSHLRAVVISPPVVMRPEIRDGLDYVLTGNVCFDQTFTVRGSDPAALSRLLSHAVRQQIIRLLRLGSTTALTVQFLNGSLSIVKARVLRRAADLAEFVQAALTLHDQALLLAGEGIEFLDGQSAQPLEHVICRICGEEIRDNLVFCRRCKTPHHWDCWHYAGRCSVFGCGETQFWIPQVAPRSESGPEACGPPDG
jgi:hypothetical protein